MLLSQLGNPNWTFQFQVEDEKTEATLLKEGIAKDEVKASAFVLTQQ